MISQDPIDPGAELTRFTEKNPQAGAIVSFTGQVRIDEHDGDATRALFLQAYEPLTQDGIAQALSRAAENWPLDDAYVRHRTGHMPPGETIVFVAAAAKHRRDAFLAADFLMDYLKTDAFFWKKDIGAQGERWVEPRDADYKDAARWDAPAPMRRPHKG